MYLKPNLPLEIVPLDNPFLPLILGEARQIYTNHIFIHYINYTNIGLQINKIYENFQVLSNSYMELKDLNTDVKEVIKLSKLKTLQIEIEKVNLQYQNLNPNITSRIKRGLLNPIGTIYKAAFGLLDNEDGEKIYSAIDILDKNQQKIHNELDKQMSLSKLLINRLNFSLLTISNNQKEIANKLNLLKQELDLHTINSVRIITLHDISEQISKECITLTNFLNQLENAIMFSRLQTVHPSIIKGIEILEMLNFLEKYYDNKNIIKFRSTLSYYQILTSQIFFEKDRIIFITNFPIVQTDKFDLYQIIPIPQNNILYYPTTPFILSTQNTKLMLEEPCHEIESIFYCTQKNYQADYCMLSTIKEESPKDCKRRSVVLQTTLTQRVDSNIIIVPVKKTEIKTYCNEKSQIIPISTPVLIKLPINCNLELDNTRYSNMKKSSKTIPLILPRIIIPEEMKVSKYQPIEIKDPKLDKIQELKHLIQHPDPLTPINITSHTYTSLITIIIIIVLIIISILFYKYVKNSKKKMTKDIPEKILMVPTTNIFGTPSTTDSP